MKKTAKKAVAPGTAGVLARFFNRLKHKLADLFEPEEVEVTFRQDGNKTTYTYTKVSHKQIA